jgi:dolichol-phosphate mannosyltransferase|tara:strand:- start:224 stop:931 length:708 start_codon:yes stop_codon:yes gene_type:complete
MNKKMNLSIVIPILNEGNNIQVLSKKIIHNLKKINYEIIFVDDNSNDKSQKILNDLKKNYKFFNPVFRKKKRDLTQSCFDGIKRSKFNNILIMDGDMQHDPKYIIPMLQVFKKDDYDIVIGARPLVKGPNQGLSETRRFASNLLIILFSVFNISTSDPMSGFFILKKNIYTKNKNFFFGKGFKILADILINSKQKLTIKDFNIQFKRRYNDKSKMNLKILIILIKFYLISIFKKI